MTNIDIYARVSRVDARYGEVRRVQSVRGQVTVCRARLVGLGHTVGRVHDQDAGKSAWNPDVKRPGWDALMARIESGQTGGVIVFDMARFSRQPIDGERLIVAAERGLVVLDSEDEYDLTTANGKKAFRDQMAGAAYESDRLSSRVARGKRQRAIDGGPNGSHRPFGFEPDGLTVRSNEAKVLREMTRRFLAGESQDCIIDDLNERGVRTSYGKTWTRAGLRQVLTRDRNVGVVVYRGAEVARLPGEPIIDREDWEMVLSVYTGRRRGRPLSPAYLCSGIVTCHCGQTLLGRPRKNMKPYPDGGVKREYWCPVQKGGCGRTAVDQRALDEHVGALAVAILGDPRHADAVEAVVRRTAGEAAKLDKQIADAELLARQLSERLGNGELTLDRYDAATGPLDKRLTALRQQRDQLPTPEASAGSVDGRATRAEWERRWDAAETHERRDLLRRALRGRRLVVNPADPTDRTNVAKRVALGR